MIRGTREGNDKEGRGPAPHVPAATACCSLLAARCLLLAGCALAAGCWLLAAGLLAAGSLLGRANAGVRFVLQRNFGAHLGVLGLEALQALLDRSFHASERSAHSPAQQHRTVVLPKMEWKSRGVKEEWAETDKTTNTANALAHLHI